MFYIILYVQGAPAANSSIFEVSKNGQRDIILQILLTPIHMPFTLAVGTLCIELIRYFSTRSQYPTITLNFDLYYMKSNLMPV